MQIDADKVLADAIRDGIRDGVKNKLAKDYDNPLMPVIKDAILAQAGVIRQLLADAIGAIMGDATFRADIATQVRHVLANQIVAKFGGELEREVNRLKSDPATRARITLAVEAIVREQTTA